jgi:hypothetical protein
MDDVITIPLGSRKYPGLVAVVDAVDAEVIARVRSWCPHVKGRRIYATGRLVDGGKQTEMHRLVMGFPDCSIDHADGDGLNNRRSNLRLATPSQNAANSRNFSPAREGLRGVTFVPAHWRAVVKVNGRRIHIGDYKSPEEAARAYDAAARKHFGEFARPNFPDDPLES